MTGKGPGGPCQQNVEAAGTAPGNGRAASPDAGAAAVSSRDAPLARSLAVPPAAQLAARPAALPAALPAAQPASLAGFVRPARLAGQILTNCAHNITGN